MRDRIGRNIDYLRVSVTDRCNLRCVYCMPKEGIKLSSHDNILSYEEIRDFCEVAVQKGVRKIRLTGGEPLVRKGLPGLVKMLSGISGVEEICMTTNGLLLSEYAERLVDNGLKRVNVSLDTIDPVSFRETTRGGDLEKVLEGLEYAKKAGLSPVKLNCVVEKDENEPDAVKIRNWAMDKGYEARFIPKMDLVRGEFGVVIGGSGGDCKNCNRLRLTSRGYLKPCLFAEAMVSIRKYDYEKAIDLALEQKPEKGSCEPNAGFCEIGG